MDELPRESSIMITNYFVVFFHPYEKDVTEESIIRDCISHTLTNEQVIDNIRAVISLSMTNQHWRNLLHHKRINRLYKCMYTMLTRNTMDEQTIKKHKNNLTLYLKEQCIEKLSNEYLFPSYLLQMTKYLSEFKPPINCAGKTMLNNISSLVKKYPAWFKYGNDSSHCNVMALYCGYYDICDTDLKCEKMHELLYELSQLGLKVYLNFKYLNQTYVSQGYEIPSLCRRNYEDMHISNMLLICLRYKVKQSHWDPQTLTQSFDYKFLHSLLTLPDELIFALFKNTETLLNIAIEIYFLETLNWKVIQTISPVVLKYRKRYSREKPMNNILAGICTLYSDYIQYEKFKITCSEIDLRQIVSLAVKQWNLDPLETNNNGENALQVWTRSYALKYSFPVTLFSSLIQDFVTQFQLSFQPDDNGNTALHAVISSNPVNTYKVITQLLSIKCIEKQMKAMFNTQNGSGRNPLEHYMHLCSLSTRNGLVISTELSQLLAKHTLKLSTDRKQMLNNHLTIALKKVDNKEASKVQSILTNC
jgi:hypothetical protein